MSNGLSTAAVSWFEYLNLLVFALLKDAKLVLSPCLQIQFESALESMVTNKAGEPQCIDLANLPGRVLASKARISIATGGTTGVGRTVSHSIQSLARAVRIDESHEDDVWGLAYEPSKIAFLQVFLQGICNWNSFVRLYDLPIDVARNAILEHRVSHLSATPTYLKMLCGRERIFPEVERVTTGGEVYPPSLTNQLQQSFPNAKFLNVYASTEAGTLFASQSDSFIVPEALQTRVRILNGHLHVHESLLGENVAGTRADGFFDTGDLVEVVSESPLTLRILGRESNWINVGGLKVNPLDVEDVLNDLPSVQDSRVYAKKNSVTGELVCAEIVPASGYVVSAQSLRNDLQTLLPAHAIPRIIQCVEEVTKTDSMKKDRKL